MGTIQEKLNAQKQFCVLLPEKFEDVTLIRDASDFPLNNLESDEYSGENSMWSYKLQTTGIYLQFDYNSTSLSILILLHDLLFLNLLMNLCDSA
jgi:hypothetical protein